MKLIKNIKNNLTYNVDLSEMKIHYGGKKSNETSYIMFSKLLFRYGY